MINNYSELCLWYVNRFFTDYSELTDTQAKNAYVECIEQLCCGRIPDVKVIMNILDLDPISYPEEELQKFKMPENQINVIDKRLERCKTFDSNEIKKIATSHDSKLLLRGLFQFLFRERIPDLRFCLDPDKYYNKDCGLFYCNITPHDDVCH